MLSLTDFRHGAISLLLGMGCLALPGCYAMQAATGEFQLLHSRQPIARVLQDPATDDKLKTRLTMVRDARDFAVKELDLPDNRSYRSYADLKRPYAVWNVVAAPRFSTTPVKWCFPVTGCISYRGYFHERAARKLAARLAKQGDDVAVYGVSAFSTLGHFADPVLNTMLGYGDLDLVGTVFHELAHQLIYISGDTRFDESFAMTMEQEGLRRWLAAQGRESELDTYLARGRNERLVIRAFTDGRSQLAALYREPLPAEQMQARKQALMQQIGQQAQALEQRYGLRTGYDTWIQQGLNNAHLASIGDYFDCVPGFQRLLAEQGGRLPDFYAAVRRVGRDAAARRALCAVPADVAQPP